MTDTAPAAPLMPGQGLGAIVAASFGLVYVWLNAGVLPTAASLPLRGLGLLAFVLVAVAGQRAGRAERAARAAGHSYGSARSPFDRRFALLVLVEAAAIFGGVAVISRVLDAPQAGVAWVSLVVGLHFFALARWWGLAFFHRLGAVLTALGLAGLVLALVGSPVAAIAVVAGVLPGLVLLGFGWWGATRRAAPAPR